MFIKKLDDFEEYEPYCEMCWKEEIKDDVRELYFGGRIRGESYRLCVSCRKKLIDILKPTC